MNPLEERLHEYLSQFDDEPMMAPSLRRTAWHERLLMNAGIVPTVPIELPHTLTAQLLRYLLNPGDDLMNTPTPSPTRVRIHSHVTQSRFLHVEDALTIGKLRLFAGSYRKGQGMDAHGFSQHFIDLADARVIFWALLRGEQGFSHKEYKGTPSPTRPERRPEVAGRRNGSGNGAVSRVLSIAVKGDNVFIELKTGPGKLTPTGAITPNGPAQVEVNVTFKLHEARCMAASVLAYLQAWDVLRMLAYKQAVGQPAPFLMVATSNENNGRSGISPRPENGASLQQNGTGKQHSGVANGRPVTRKDVVKANGAVAAKPINGYPAAQQPLQYGNGTLVDGKNITEVQTFRRYKAEKQAAPASKADLLDYYRERIQAPALSI
ncbi:MAG: hypothetical protein IT327_23700 [Anaerolineae bacterium]|nr:hypothetical protein [Anaerolineae bacterium]